MTDIISTARAAGVHPLACSEEYIGGLQRFAAVLREENESLHQQRDAIQAAAQAVLDRWDSPAWEWVKQGPTAALMADLRAAIKAVEEAKT